MASRVLPSVARLTLGVLECGQMAAWVATAEISPTSMLPAGDKSCSAIDQERTEEMEERCVVQSAG